MAVSVAEGPKGCRSKAFISTVRKRQDRPRARAIVCAKSGMYPLIAQGGARPKGLRMSGCLSLDPMGYKLALKHGVGTMSSETLGLVHRLPDVKQRVDRRFKSKKCFSYKCIVVFFCAGQRCAIARIDDQRPRPVFFNVLLSVPDSHRAVAG